MNLTGVYPAILTPFDEHGRFGPGPFRSFIAHLYASGVHGLFVCGYCGEGLLMDVAEREAVAAEAVAASRGKGGVIVHAGAARTEDAVRLASHASGIGAEAVAALAPASATTTEALKDYFGAVAQAAAPLPTLIYYNPGAAPALGSYSVLEQLLDLPGIGGLKFTGTDAAELACAILQRATRQTVLAGVDEMFLAALLMGAHGSIGAFVNIAAGLFLEIYGLASQGHWTAARQPQRRMIELIRAVERYPFLSALKTIARWQGFELGQPRSPHLSLTAEQERQLRAEVSPFFPLAAP